ncbi:MAG: DUF4173 domain-containing protein [Anaerolineales bacterium]|nr:DUF4173 domain-containing protein [Anaerolineales bacterium]
MDNEIDSPKQNSTPKQHRSYFLLIALVTAVLFDQMVWQKSLGMQFLILILLILVGGLVLIFIEKARIAWQSTLLLVPILFMDAMTVLRLDGFTNFSNVVVSLFSLGLLAITLLNGQWLHFRLREHLLGFLHLALSMLIEPVRWLMEAFKRSERTPEDQKTSKWVRLTPFLRGLLIAVPVLIVLSALLASADPIFARRLASIFDWITIDKLFEIIFRLIYISVLAYGLTGAYLHAFTHSAKKQQIEPDQPVIAPFLGRTEYLMVLISINLLFFAFLIIQFQYFFAGEANISYEGFTYAEYARRGFFELLAVALISLLLFLGLSATARRDTKWGRRLFSGLGILLMLQVGVILLSAFQRLNLYEQAYGLTQLRTVTYVFMIWLGILLFGTVALEVFSRLKRMALLLIVVILGFTVTLNLIKVDAFIADRNIQHAASGHPLDVNYLIWNLSADAVPVMFAHFNSGDLPEDIRAELGAVLACRAYRAQDEGTPKAWVSYHYSKARAADLYQRHAEYLKGFPLLEQDDGWYLQLEGELVYCQSK